MNATANTLGTLFHACVPGADENERRTVTTVSVLKRSRDRKEGPG